MASDSADLAEDLGELGVEGEISSGDMDSEMNSPNNSHVCSTPKDDKPDTTHGRNRKNSPPSSVSLSKDAACSSVTVSSENGAQSAICKKDTNNSNPGDGGSLKPEEITVFASMKKDDSGIDIEKSPTSVRDCSLPSDGEGNDSVCESFFTDSATGSRTNSMSEYKGKSHLDEGPSEIEDGAFSTEVLKSQSDKTATKDNNVTDTVEAVAESVENSESSSGEVKTSVRQKRHTKSSSSDCDDDDDDDDDDEAESTDSKNKHKESDSEDEDYAAFEKPRKLPKHKWKALDSFRRRENGFSNKLSSHLFQQRVSGSLRMVQRLDLMTKLEYHEGCVNTLSFNRTGSLLASGSDDLDIVLWDWVRGKPALIFDSGHRSNVFQAKFMPYSGDCHVVSCARDGQVRLAELSLTGICKGTKKLAQHKGAAHKLALEYDSPYTFLSCGEDAVMFEIDLRNEKPNRLGTTKENDRKVALYSIHSNPSNPHEYCVGGRDHFIRVYDKRKIEESVNGGVLKKFCPHHLIDSEIKANVTCACYSYDGLEILGTFNDEDVYLFDSTHSDGADFIHRYKGHRNNATVKGVNFYGPKSEFIMSGSDCGHVFMWDKETEEVVQYMEGDVGGVVNVLEPHPMAPCLATSGLDHDIKIWTPTAEDATKLKGLRKAMRENRRLRKYERSNEPEMIDGQMLWFLLHHIRRSSRRRARQEGEHFSSSSDSSEAESEEEEETQERMQCSPS